MLVTIMSRSSRLPEPRAGMIRMGTTMANCSQAARAGMPCSLSSTILLPKTPLGISVKKTLMGAEVHIMREPSVAARRIRPMARVDTSKGMPKWAKTAPNTSKIPVEMATLPSGMNRLTSSEAPAYRRPMVRPAITTVRTKALTPPLRSLRNTPTDSAPPTPWMIQASVPKKPHAVAKLLMSGAMLAGVGAVANSTPPKAAARDSRMNTAVRPRAAVEPKEEMEPIHLAPLVETHVAIAKTTISIMVIHSCESSALAPKNT